VFRGGADFRPDYYELIEEPIDLTTIDKRINSGYYVSARAFHTDFDRLLSNAEVSVSHVISSLLVALIVHTYSTLVHV